LKHIRNLDCAIIRVVPAEEHGLFIQLMKLKNTLRYLRDEEKMLRRIRRLRA
jgi:hypothetical protein